MDTLYNHFKNLLVSPPDISDEDEEIAPILEGLIIKVGLFSDEEYETAKKSLVERKTNGEDNILPEVYPNDATWMTLCWISAMTHYLKERNQASGQYSTSCQSKNQVILA